MRRTSALFAVAALLIAGQARATVLTFDEIAPNFAGVPDGYGGLDWSNMHVLDTTTFGPSGYENGVVSGDWVAFNNSGLAAELAVGLFDFHSAFLTAAFHDGLNIRVDGFAGGALTHSQTVVVDTAGPTFVNFNFTSIDSLVFTSFGGVANPAFADDGTHFALDNMTLDVAAPVVPEPGSLALMGLGAAGLLMARRKRTRMDGAALDSATKPTV